MAFQGFRRRRGKRHAQSSRGEGKDALGESYTLGDEVDEHRSFASSVSKIYCTCCLQASSSHRHTQSFVVPQPTFLPLSAYTWEAAGCTEKPCSYMPPGAQVLSGPTQPRIPAITSEHAARRSCPIQLRVPARPHVGAARQEAITSETCCQAILPHPNPCSSSPTRRCSHASDENQRNMLSGDRLLFIRPYGEGRPHGEGRPLSCFLAQSNAMAQTAP